jgi:hypothetical protein
MTLKEIRCVKHLVAAAEFIGPSILRDYAGFEHAMWRTDIDMKRFDMDPRQFQHCLKAAFVELTQIRK